MWEMRRDRSTRAEGLSQPEGEAIVKRLVKYVSVSAFMVVALVASRTASAQNVARSQGWPDAENVKVTAPVAVKAPVVKAPVAKPAPVAPKPAPPVVTASSDLVAVMQQQADLLGRLAGELDQQRKMVEAQQQVIQALEARGAAAAATPVTPAAAVTIAAVPKAAPAPPTPAITVETGGAKLKLAGLVQGWYTFGGSSVVDSFRLRRTEIKLTGDMSPRVRWTLMFDPSKSLSVSNSYSTVNGQKTLTDTSVSQGSRILQDAYVGVTYSPELIVEVGQQKVPLGLEGTQSSGKLETIDRALFMSDKARGAGYGDFRDLGVMVRGKAFGNQFEYYGGVFNGLGEGQNDTDRNDQKAYAARAVIKPSAVKGFQVGGSIARGAFTSDVATRRERQGVELQYTSARFGVKSEFMAGRDGLVSRQGYYGQVTVRPVKKAEFLFRADAWDPDTHLESTVATVRELDYVGGFSFFGLAPNTMFQANYVRKTFTAGLSPSRNVFLLNLQTSW